MKKVVMVLIMLVMVIMAVAANAAEDIVRSDNEIIYGSTVQGWIEEWAKKNGYEEYLASCMDENGVWRGYGVIDADAFEEMYGFEVSDENLIKVAHEASDKVEIEIRYVGEYEGFAIKVMKCFSNGEQIIGYDDYDGTEIPYYSGEMLYMVWSMK